MGFNHRRKARILLCQAVYQYSMTQTNSHLIMHQFLDDNADKKYDNDYFTTHYPELFTHLKMLDQHIAEVLQDKTLSDVTPMELSVCRVGAYELLYVHAVPYKVVIAEALHIEQRFGSEDGYKFVNGILHALATRFRPQEMAG